MYLQLCKKEVLAIVGKGLIMLKIQSLENPPKKLPIFLARISKNKNKFTTEVNFEKIKKNVTPKSQPNKVLHYYILQVHCINQPPRNNNNNNNK